MGYRVSKITRRNFRSGYGEKAAWDAFSKEVRYEGLDPGEKPRCETCGLPGTKDNPITASHYTPTTRGGRNTKLNTLRECMRCNLRRSAQRRSCKVGYPSTKRRK